MAVSANIMVWGGGGGEWEGGVERERVRELCERKRHTDRKAKSENSKTVIRE